MFGSSSLRASPGHRAVARNLTLDLVASVGVGVTTATIVALLPTIARRGGLEPIGLAALAAAPFLANFLGAFAGRFGPRTPGQLATVRGLGAASLLLVLVTPVPPVMIGATLIFWLSLSFGSPYYLRLWGAMYPPRILGRLLGAAGMARSSAAVLAAIVGGLVADQIGGPVVLGLAGGAGIACAFAYAGLRAHTTEPPVRFTARESFQTLRDRPILARIALAQGFYGGGLIAALPLFALVYVDRLALSLADVGVIGVLTAGATLLAFPAWGLVADRAGALPVIRIGSVAGTIALVGYAVAPSVGVLWLASVAAGIGGAAIDVGLAAIVSDATPLRSRAAAWAGWNAITGARGIGTAFVMSVLLQLGVVDVTSGLVLCAASSAVGVVLFVRTRPGAESPATDEAPSLSGAVAAIDTSTLGQAPSLVGG